MDRKYLFVISLMTMLVMLLFFINISFFSFVLILFSLEIAAFSSFKSHSDVFCQGKITRSMLVGNIFLDVFVILLMMLLAGFLGNYIALLATKQITNMLTRFIVGIIIGLVVGIGVGIFVKRTWEKIKLYFSKAQSQ